MKSKSNIWHLWLFVAALICGANMGAHALSLQPLSDGCSPFTALSDTLSVTSQMTPKEAEKAAKKQAKEEAKKARNHEKYLEKQAKKQAQREKDQARAVAKAQKEAAKMAKKLAEMKPQTVYIYGAGINFLDSVVYVTDFQHIDSVYIEPDGELRDYYAYSGDLKFYLESHYNLENETCAVFYMTDEKKASKRFAKMDAKLRKQGYLINRVSKDDFTFVRQEDKHEE